MRPDLLAPFRGSHQFGPAYARMYANDAHAPGSVDRVLLDRMALLCAQTAPVLYPGTPPPIGDRTSQRPDLERIVAGLARQGEDIVTAVATSCAGLAEYASHGLDALRLGGAEEAIIARGSDWCTDVARVACALYQVAGLPSRLVYLANPDAAYSGHAIVEAWSAGGWGAVDPTTDVVYRHPDGRPASVWDLQRDPRLVTAHCRGDQTPCTTPEQFRRAAIAEYAVADAARYDYTVSEINAYYWAILAQASKGWPGGLHWLFGEEQGEAS